MSGFGGPPPAAGAPRLGYLDWARGLAVLVMIQTHALLAWTAPTDRSRPLLGLARLAGGYPAALFLFLAGLAAALLGERERTRGTAGAEVRRRGLRRGALVMGYAVLFRLWMLASGAFARPADLLRVDVLNCIGVSLLLVAVVALGHERARARVLASAGLAVAVALLTPLAWDGPLVKRWPAPILGYVSGRIPDAFFPIFPWTAFAALGSTAGVLLAAARERGREGTAVAIMSAAGAAAIPAALFADRHLPAVYPTDDFWYTSPAYVALKAGVVLVVLGVAYVADKVPGPSALRQLGRTSLLVYWVHVEIVYGQWVMPAARGHLALGEAMRGVGLLALAMLALSLARTRARPARTPRGTTPAPAVAQAQL